MDRISNILYYVEDEVDAVSLGRIAELAAGTGAQLTLGAVVRPARSQVLLTRASFDLDEVERLLVQERERQLNELAAGCRTEQGEVAP